MRDFFEELTVSMIILILAIATLGFILYPSLLQSNGDIAKIVIDASLIKRGVYVFAPLVLITVIVKILRR